MNNSNYLHSDITKQIIGAFYSVYNELGYGFPERVYENAMMIELEELGIDAERQYPVPVFYKRRNVGDYKADLFVRERVIVELKAAAKIVPEHEVQLVHYL